MKYKEQLKTQEWKALRQLVLEDRGFKCEQCSTENNLHIHHTFYELGKKCWEYEIKDLQVLCRDCHKQWHRQNKIKIVGNKNKIIKSAGSSATSQESFYMSFIENMSGFFKLRSAIDIKVLAKVCMIAEYNSGRVLITSVVRKEIIEFLNISTQQLTNSLASLKANNLITGERGTYYINPKVFWKGHSDVRDSFLKKGGLLSVKIDFETE